MELSIAIVHWEPLLGAALASFLECFPIVVVFGINAVDFVAAFLADIGSWCALSDCSKENMNSQSHWIPTPPVTAFARMEGHPSVGLGHGSDSLSRFFVDSVFASIG